MLFGVFFILLNKNIFDFAPTVIYNLLLLMSFRSLKCSNNVLTANGIQCVMHITSYINANRKIPTV